MKERVLLKTEVERRLEDYRVQLQNEELSVSTIRKYIADVKQWLSTADEEMVKGSVQQYKENMCCKYKITSVNSKIISINRYLKWLGYDELVVKTKRLQSMYNLDNVISREDYMAMLDCAKSERKMKMYYIMKTIAQTGIRISELQYVTVAAITKRSTVVMNKGKARTIYFTDALCDSLKRYCKDNNLTQGYVFLGRYRDRPITPGAVWKGLKYIGNLSGVPEELVYPHSFRHLFAKEYMRKVGDITELADLLGHSRLETTWRYTKTTADEKRERLERLEL